MARGATAATAAGLLVVLAVPTPADAADAADAAVLICTGARCDENTALVRGYLEHWQRVRTFTTLTGDVRRSDVVAAVQQAAHTGRDGRVFVYVHGPLVPSSAGEPTVLGATPSDRVAVGELRDRARAGGAEVILVIDGLVAPDARFGPAPGPTPDVLEWVSLSPTPGTFTQTVVRGLIGAADLRADGEVTAAEAHRYVRDELGPRSAGALTVDAPETWVWTRMPPPLPPLQDPVTRHRRVSAAGVGLIATGGALVIAGVAANRGQVVDLRADEPVREVVSDAFFLVGYPTAGVGTLMVVDRLARAQP